MPRNEEDTIIRVKKINTKKWLGFEVVTTKQNISLVIENIQLCCEDWGAACDHDAKFIGAIIKKVGWGRDVFDKRIKRTTAIIEIMTDMGKLELSVWNEHDGYYEHDVQASWHNYQDTQSI